MNTVWKRICGLTLAVLLVLTNLPAQTAFAGRAEATDVQSSEELEAAINGGAEFIRIKADFALDRTFYVTGSTVLFADEAHTLTRAADFGGDLFVVGVSAEGTAAAAPVTMELGTESGAGLVLDGNKTGLNADLTVTGTALYVTENAALTIHDDVSFRNLRKDGNVRTIEDELGSAADVGGAAVIAASGSVTIQGARFENNESAGEGGALYFAADTTGNISGAIFTGNKATGENGSGGALGTRSAEVTATQTDFTDNTADENGGAVFVSYTSASGHGSQVILNEITAQGNTTGVSGGFIYCTNSELTVYDSNLRQNSAVNNGGAVELLTTATSGFYNVAFEENTAGNNGGAIHDYTGESVATLNTCSFTANEAGNYGGALFVSNGNTILRLYNSTATGNKAGNGGVLYETTTGASVTINGLMVSGNTASVGGPIIYGNTTKAFLYLNKANYTDSDHEGELDAAYWSAAIANKLTVNEIMDDIPGYYDYYGVYHGESHEDPGEAKREVATAEELERSVNAGLSEIILIEDFAIDRTLYVMADTKIFTEDAHTLTRAAGFAGDLFVVGVSSEGTHTETPVTMELGSESGAGLVIDGNRTSLDEGLTVTGTAVYVSGSSAVTIHDDVSFRNLRKDGNVRTIADSLGSAKNVGGAAVIAASGSVTIQGARFENNEAAGEGSAVYYAADTAGNITGAIFSGNKATGENGSGGALGMRSAAVTVTETSFTGNSADANGGALFVSYTSASGHGSQAILNEVTAEGNTAGANGGFVYNSNSELTVYDSTLRQNSAATHGGAASLHSASTNGFFNTIFEYNTAGKNGGAIYDYTGAAEATVNNCSFTGNEASNFGGAMFVSNGDTVLKVYNSGAEGNKAGNGGVLYETTTGATVTLNGLTISGNTATTAGPIIYGNTTGAVLNLNKENYTDKDHTGELGEEYWAEAIANKLTVNEITEDIPGYYDYYGYYHEKEKAVQGVTDVQTADELEAAIAGGAKRIRVTADFFLDRTFYITGSTTIYATSSHKLTRAKNFAGDLFVIGEDASGVSAISRGRSAVLTLGDPDASTANLLIIDGNRKNMTVPVKGTVLFTCFSAVTNVYADVSIINHLKTGNARTLEERYNLSSPENIGGAAAITAQGVLNIYGGRFQNNAVNDETVIDAENTDKTSSTGGVIFNFSNLYIYGGTFSNNQAARGGVIYNYRLARIYGGTFSGNTATTYAGVIYQPDSQYSETLIGKETGETPVLFKNNHSAGIGGVAFVQNKAALIVYGNTTFRGNASQNSNGGVICCYGTLTVNGAVFENNSAYQRGGAIYVSNANEELTTRYCSISGSTFRGNTANRGGAVGIFASESTFSEGGKASFSDCIFESNTAADPTANGTASDIFGGALYVSRHGTLGLSGCTLSGNSAVDEGGAVYISGESTVNITDCTLSGNSATRNQAGNGGAVAIHSAYLTISDTGMNENTSSKNGGALYVSYTGTSTIDSSVKLNNVSFEKNRSGNYGGALYTTAHLTDSADPVIKAEGTTFAENHSPYNGGAAYFTGGAYVYFHDTIFRANVSDALATSSGSRCGGGALYVTGADVELNKVTFENNSSDYNGGAAGLYSDGRLTLNDFTASGNTAANNGGFIYVNGAELKAYSGTVSGNSAKGGGAINIYTSGKAGLYEVTFSGNSATNNGGALYVYTEGTEVVSHDCVFQANTAENYGGAIYASNASVAAFYNASAIGNAAAQGGFLYETTKNTVVTLNGLTVSGNTATTSGPIIYGNSAGAVLNINKNTYQDQNAGSLDDAYWAEAIAGKLTVNEISDAVPGYSGYSHEEEETPGTKPQKLTPVSTILALASQSSMEPTGTAIDNYPALDTSSNFMSLSTTAFKNVNGGTVTVDSFVNKPNVPSGNPNVAEGLLIYQAMLYKEKHPSKEVYIDISSFRFSVNAAICLNRNSPYFGYMRNLPSKTLYDEFGFVRIAYLLVTAASMGIHVTVVGQLDAYPKSGVGFEEFFTRYLDSACDADYAAGHKLSEYLDFHACYWTSYGDDAATDMMHTKVCAVSNYTDMNGKDHGYAVWNSSTNLDGVTDAGYNGNNKVQTATLISGHEALYRITRNYVRLIGQYCGQEDVYLFRELVVRRTEEQIRLINKGKEDQIPANDQIVYLGRETDSVFELYFTPLGGDSGIWDAVRNPFCKYFDKLAGSDDYMYLIWNNAKFYYHPLSRLMLEKMSQAFHNNRNPENQLFLLLEGSDTELLEAQYSDLEKGKDIGYISLNKKIYANIHNKDILLSYSENGQRNYVSLLNSLNVHNGSMSYQSNQILVIKETSCTANSVFYTFATQTSGVMPEHSKPAVVIQPKDASVEVGAKATFKIVATGAESYQWYYRTSSSGDWQAVKSGGTSATYRLTVQARHDGYQYRCKVTNGNGSTYSGIATLKVLGAPKITKQPKSVTVTVGYPAQFTVKASDAESYQWYYSKNQGASWIAVRNNGTSETYELITKDRHNGYQYRCTITNAYGSTDSAVVTLTVTQLPMVTTQPKSVTVTEGEAAQFKVEATGAESYQWYYSKDQGASWVAVKINGTSAAYSLTTKARHNGYQYRCTVTNAYGSVDSDIVTLTVLVMPKITAQPTDVTVAEGDVAEFTVEATGAERYQWYYSKDQGASWVAVKINGMSAVYRLATKARHNGYQYRCTVTNANGSVDSDIVTLTVLLKPQITTQPKNVTVSVGNTATFTVKATGAVSYQWYYSKDKGVNWVAVRNNGTSATYKLKTEARHDGYQYRCTVTNANGSVDTDVVTLTVLLKPQITTQPKSVTVTLGSTATFTVEATGAENYQWYYSKDQGVNWIAVRNNGTSATYKLKTEARHDGYQYRCTVTNANGSVDTDVVTLTVTQ